MKVRHKGMALLAAAGMATLLLTGVAVAGPMGGGTGGGGMGGTTSTAVMQPGTDNPGAGMGGTTSTAVMQPGTDNPGAGMGWTTGTTIMPSGTGMSAGHMFKDVATDDWFAQYAQNMASNGFMNGYANGTFGPELPITRGQFAGILGRMMNVQPVAGTTFPDTRGFWGAGMVEAMARMGIIAGHDDGTFGPYGSITREQMAAIMDRAWEATHGDATLAGTANAMADMMHLVHDASESWAAPQIARMMQMGVFIGSSGMFHPTDTATRAQAAAVMWRWFSAGQAQQ